MFEPSNTSTLRLGDSIQNEMNHETQTVEETDSEDNEFYLESDHLALKNNTDYISLLRTVCILEAQRHKAIKDVDTLLSLLHQANDDPVNFAQLVVNGKLELPGLQTIASLPNIDWAQYNIPESEVNRQFTQQKINDTDAAKKEDVSGKIFVRGRMFDDSKPETFNQLWTTEEQRRLDELLIEYPNEEVETNRYRKIAEALGNRTYKQVCSRIQKYFAKLHNAGMPIPGRQPKSHRESLKRSSHHHQKNNKYLFRPTTFFPSHNVPVHMPESEENFPIMGPSTSSFNPKTQFRDDDSRNSDNSREFVVSEKVKNTRNHERLELLREVLCVKESGNFEHLRHEGFKCNFCCEEPIIGVRWHCAQCTVVSVDYCSDCVVSQMESANPHPLSHSLTPIKKVQTHWNGIYDPDYLPSSFASPGLSYNYLDPNFMPG